MSAVADGPTPADPSARFVAPLFVPSAPAGVPGPAGGDDVLTPDTVVTPGPPVASLAPKAEFRPA
ncbi:hypothetical protein AB1207_06540 [Kineococcus endophyticus]|uniref:Uncharacterized protein n=1 Tax=Kineococcus endophyticus TaxID=1181883 RepID=A0ABV3P4S8_9ACTN